MQFTALVSNDTSGVTWSVNSVAGGNSTVGTIDANGNFTAPAVTQNATATITATSKKDTTKSGTATATVIAPGVVAATANAQVASYTITVPDGLNVLVQFGPDTNYGLVTSAPLAPSGGGSVTILVAGMRANTAYHMRAVFQSNSQTVFNDADHTFTTTSYPVANLPLIAAAAAAGMTPQSGVELLDLGVTGTKIALAVTDLTGNLLWAYVPGASVPTTDGPNPIKLLPNGHFLINFSNVLADGKDSVLQEIDLAGTVVWQMTTADLNAKLAQATCAGCNITVVGTHHDFALLPNGHIILLASRNVPETGLIGQPSPITVSGDVAIDLDQNRNPVWVWDSFDPSNQDPNHLDLNRHPLLFPDWLHSNAIVYSPSDHNLIISMRHQNWIIKVDYNDGQDTGKILWRLGYHGDFTLVNGTDPEDWFADQHDVNVITDNSSGVFQITLFDNGNQHKVDSSGTLCGGAIPCSSRVPIFQLDETAKTATIVWVDDLAPVFSFFAGNSRLLANGNVEFCEASQPTFMSPNSAIFEVTKTTPPQMVWQMQISGQNTYRGFRIPSLYPGVQW